MTKEPASTICAQSPTTNNAANSVASASKTVANSIPVHKWIVVVALFVETVTVTSSRRKKRPHPTVESYLPTSTRTPGRNRTRPHHPNHAKTKLAASVVLSTPTSLVSSVFLECFSFYFLSASAKSVASDHALPLLVSNNSAHSTPAQTCSLRFLREDAGMSGDKPAELRDQFAMLRNVKKSFGMALSSSCISQISLFAVAFQERSSFSAKKTQ